MEFGRQSVKVGEARLKTEKFHAEAQGTQKIDECRYRQRHPLGHPNQIRAVKAHRDFVQSAGNGTGRFRMQATQPVQEPRGSRPAGLQHHQQAAVCRHQFDYPRQAGLPQAAAKTQRIRTGGDEQATIRHPAQGQCFT